MLKMKGDKLFITLFLLPAGLITTVFLYYPFFKSFFLSFYSMQGWFGGKTFVGFENYIRLFTDEVARGAFLHSIELMLLVVVFQVGIAMVLAVMVESVKHWKGFFRTTFFFPVVISGSAIALLFTLVYQYRGGMLNSVLGFFGIEPVLWLNEQLALLAVAVPTIWQYVGFYFVILLTAIMKIPDSFYEAADLEGVGIFKRATMITIPLIFNDLKVCIILAITGALRIFDIIQLLTAGGPAHATTVLATYMYTQTFVANDPGYGTTVAVLIVVLGIVISMITNRYMKQEEITY